MGYSDIEDNGFDWHSNTAIDTASGTKKVILINPDRYGLDSDEETFTLVYKASDGTVKNYTAYKKARGLDGTAVCLSPWGSCERGDYTYSANIPSKVVFGTTQGWKNI